MDKTERLVVYARSVHRDRHSYKEHDYDSIFATAIIETQAQIESVANAVTAFKTVGWPDLEDPVLGRHLTRNRRVLEKLYDLVEEYEIYQNSYNRKVR